MVRMKTCIDLCKEWGHQKCFKIESIEVGRRSIFRERDASSKVLQGACLKIISKLRQSAPNTIPISIFHGNKENTKIPEYSINRLCPYDANDCAHLRKL